MNRGILSYEGCSNLLFGDDTSLWQSELFVDGIRNFEEVEQGHPPNNHIPILSISAAAAAPSGEGWIPAT